MSTIDLHISKSNPMDRGLFCPFCGCEQVYHFTHAVYSYGHDAYDASPLVRGDIIRIPMICEHGCRFDLAIGQHKDRVATWATFRHEADEKDWEALERAKQVAALGEKCDADEGKCECCFHDND